MNKYLPNAESVWQSSPITVEFSYQNFEGVKSRRKVDVQQILVDKSEHLFYLYGYCHLKDEFRHFKHTNITTMLKIGSHRFHFEEFIEDKLGLNMTEILGQDHASSSVISTKNSGNKNCNISKKPRTFDQHVNTWLSRFPSVKTYGAALLAILLITAYVFGKSSAESPQPQTDNTTIPSYQEADEIATTPQPDNPVYGGPLTDCELAGTLVMDMVPILDSLNQQVKKANSSVDYSYRDFAEWRVSYFNDALDKVQMKYPSRFAIDYPNSRMAYSDISVGTGLYVQAYFQYLKSGRDPELKLPYQQHWDTIFQAGKQIDASCKSSWESAEKQ